MSLKDLKKKVEAISAEALEEFKKSTNVAALYEQKVQYLGKKGKFSQLKRELGTLSPEEKPIFGELLNQKSKILEESYAKLKKNCEDQELEEKIKTEHLDLTLPGPEQALGHRHPIQLVIDEMVSIFSRLGYSVRTGPLVESDHNNFTALNIPENHPARDMQDTFYVEGGYVLRTHTSPVQIRTLKSEKVPLRILAPGSVFRRDNDISHAPNFHQLEGLLVDKKVSMADLKGTLSFWVKEFFGAELKTRFRPSFFPFTEPSAEVDCQCLLCQGNGCSLCSQTGWVEIGGCGLVHPHVLDMCDISSETHQGFAFGLGIERIAIIKYGISNIRLFNENDVRFLNQFLHI